MIGVSIASCLNLFRRIDTNQITSYRINMVAGLTRAIWHYRVCGAIVIKGQMLGLLIRIRVNLCLFNPRIHNWADHFQFEGGTIQPLTSEARVTIRILHINDTDRVVERERLLDANLY